MSRIWILLPAYNEADSLPFLLPKISAQMAATGREYRIVVGEDGSADGSAPLLSEFASRFPLNVVSHPLNRGLGETERDLFEYVFRHANDDDVVVRMDCDDTHEPQYVDALMTRLAEGYDVVVTSRFQRGGGQLGVSRYRALVSYGANIFMRVLFGIPGLRDYSCGFRAYRAAVLKDAIQVFGNSFLQLRGLGFTSTLEAVVKLHLLGCRFAEVPFVLRYDQKRSPSKMVSSITTLGYLTMAILYHWPFGGWRQQYRGLAQAWRRDRATVTDTARPFVRAMRAPSRISL